MTDPVLDSQPANSTGEMDGLCPELLLIPPPLSNRGILEPVQNPCPSGNPPPLPGDPGCLLVEATATEEDTGNMEIIVEAVAGNLSPGAPGETPAPKLSPGEGEPSEEAGASLPGQESAEEEDIEDEEESGSQKNSQKALEKGQGALQLEGAVASGTESLFKTHMCPECKRCFKKRTHLVEHLHLHFPDPSLQCPNCQKFFTSKSKLKTHLLRELGQKAHRCPLCHYSAVERNALNRHMASMHEDISNFYSDTYACPVCREEFRLSQALKEHLKSHTAAATAEPLPLRCFQEGCSYTAPDRKAFVKHLKETHGVRAVECRHHSCPMLFSTAEAMEAHHKSHYAFHCPHCDFACSNKHLFRKHKKQGHPGSEELRCTFCPFATFNPVAYQDHVGKMHAHEKIHQCPECSFATAHKRVLIRHMLLHTGEKPHKCELCNFTCRDVSYLSKHMLTHSNTKDYMCTECGYVTKWKHYLSVHMRKHAGDLRYQCNQCSYRCHRADQLSSHKLRHQGKSLMCEVCAFACKRKYELQKHMASQHHPSTPAPLYPCRYCSYQSRHKQALLSHENCKHTRLREFRCALCDYRTFSNTTLFFHKRKAHGYVPGDQVWQLRCASQEPEGARQCPTPPPDSEPSSQLSAQPEGLDHDPGTVVDPSLDQALPETSEEDSAGKQEGSEVPQGDDLVGSPIPAEVDEGGCTLHLEALGVELEPVAEPPLEEITETAPVEFRPLDPSGPLRLEGPDGTLTELSTFEGAGTSGLGAEEPILEKPASEPRINATSSEEPPNSWVGTFKANPPTETAPLPQFPESESLLKALRRQDKEQAEALVLEGRVQMVVIQGEGRAFRCPHCPFITRREKALNLHSRTGCQGRREPLLCPECGASFKQQRGLSTHLLKKCPVLLRKNKGLPRPGSPIPMHPQPPGSLTSEDAEGGKPPPAPLEVEIVLPKDAPSALPREPEKIEEPLATLCGSAVPPAGDSSPTEAPEKFHFEQGKFHCNSCMFLCSRLSSITSHVAEGCRGGRGGGGKQGASQTQPVVSPLNSGDSGPLSNGSTERSPGDGDAALVPKQKGARFSCPTCPFSCQQERALRTHQTRGCPLEQSGELHCDLCPFTAPAAAALRLHQKRRHHAAAPARSPRPPLQCADCGFTCKQSRCLQQHRRLKHEGVKPHQCPFCDFSTTRRYRLEAHQSRHTGVGRIPCSSCPQTFGTNSKLRLHRLRVHDKTPTHFCPLCDYSGYLRHDITRHVNSCHQGTPAFACPQCEAQFSSETALKQHALRRHPEPTPAVPGSPAEAVEGPLHCSRCGLLCPSPASLRGHTRKQHPRLECGACQEAFPSRPALDEHRRQQHFSHRCQLCDFAARERVGLVKHYLEQHEETSAAAATSAGDGDAGQPPLRCPFCDFACRHQLVLDHHVKGHGGTRLYKCTDCAYSTKNRQKITWHSRIHTGEKPYRCHLCPYACADPSRLKYHMRIHKEERKYLCPDCGYKCKWVNQLKYHMTKHTGLKPYQCPECEYCTNRADALRVHQETRHREARAFMCEQCGKAFKTRFLLRTHLRKHSEAKPYVCNVCHRAFRWAAGLRHHALTHTDRHPFFCRLCSYKAKQKFQVVKHVRRHHPDQADPNQGVGKDPTTPTVHLHDVQLEDPSPPAPTAPPTGPEG
ncbi:zinc finger protein 142 isoform X3 [Hippopotamus amphibius kiboko]|uniref:zinc finger protein 142 isoform X3 n=1 Tax=Hippopotamus amphibius kiboko TaxID=575201 RepID=UPI0025996114|nr:zinc finger protein 142 isoform X3 [Hippopotamus amphibius kiboko]